MKKFVLITKSFSGDTYHYNIQHPVKPTDEEISKFLKYNANDKDLDADRGTDVLEEIVCLFEVSEDFIPIPTSTTLYSPINEAELELIRELKFTGFPPRLTEQPIFYPVMNEQYAKDINKWNIQQYGAGFIAKFEVDTEYLKNFKVENVGMSHHNELWIPAEELENFNSHIIGSIDIL